MAIQVCLMSHCCDYQHGALAQLEVLQVKHGGGASVCTAGGPQTVLMCFHLLSGYWTFWRASSLWSSWSFTTGIHRGRAKIEPKRSVRIILGLGRSFIKLPIGAGASHIWNLYCVVFLILWELMSKHLSESFWSSLKDSLFLWCKFSNTYINTLQQ